MGLPDFDPESTERLRLTATEIFRAGEATASLRVKLELGDVVNKGVRAEAVAQDRARKGGIKSAEARSKRIAALIDEMESIICNNPIAMRIGASRVAELAAQVCAEADPALWRQGLGQVEEYVGEIRRGEAGMDLQERFRMLFLSKSA